MKILILSFYFAPDLCPGSFRSTAFVEQLRKLAAKDCQIDVITTIPNRYASFQMQANSLEETYGLTIHRVKLPSHKSGMLDQAYAFYYFLKQTLKIIKSKNYNLVFATSSRLMTAALGSYISRKKNAKLYLDVRDIFTDTICNILPSYAVTPVKPFLNLLEDWTFKRAERINLNSKGFTDYFVKKYPHIPLKNFSNGVDPEFEALGSVTSVAIETKPPYQVLYAGNIGEGQGLHLILPILAKRLEGQVNFTIIGDGGRKEFLQKEIIRNECSNILLLAPVARKELIEAYKKADILFLHLNSYQAFKRVLPSKIFEYAAMGKPIWAGVAGYAQEFLQQEVDNCAIFVPCDVDGAIDSMKKLHIRSNSRSAFIEKFRRKNIMHSMAQDVLSLLT